MCIVKEACNVQQQDGLHRNAWTNTKQAVGFKCPCLPTHMQAQRGRDVSTADAVSSSRAMLDVLSKDANPKMQNSKCVVRAEHELLVVQH